MVYPGGYPADDAPDDRKAQGDGFGGVSSSHGKLFCFVRLGIVSVDVDKSSHCLGLHQTDLEPTMFEIFRVADGDDGMWEKNGSGRALTLTLCANNDP